jgi:hypothetical protein
MICTIGFHITGWTHILRGLQATRVNLIIYPYGYERAMQYDGFLWTLELSDESIP